MSEISVVWEKLKFDSFTGGCYTPLTHAAIDRTLTTILVSFPNGTSSVWKKLPALGGRLVSCDISIQGFKFELHAGALPFCYPWPHKNVLFYGNSKNIAFRTVNVLALHKTLPLKDSCSNSDCFSDWARYGSPSTCNPSHATKVSGRLVMELYLPGCSVFAANLCREVVIYWQNYGSVEA